MTTSVHDRHNERERGRERAIAKEELHHPNKYEMSVLTGDICPSFPAVQPTAARQPTLNMN